MMNKKQQDKEDKLPNLHSSMGSKALEYFGWEFAKEEQPK